MEMVYEKVKLFRKQMEILIPEGFKDMPDYVAKKKYPSKHRPPVILIEKIIAMSVRGTDEHKGAF